MYNRKKNFNNAITRNVFANRINFIKDFATLYAKNNKTPIDATAMTSANNLMNKIENEFEKMFIYQVKEDNRELKALMKLKEYFCRDNGIEHKNLYKNMYSHWGRGGFKKIPP